MPSSTPLDAARDVHPSAGPWFTVGDAAKYLDVSRATLYRLMEDRMIAYKLVTAGRSRRSRRISVRELDRFIKRQGRAEHVKREAS